jgi:hypothetical protein
MGYQPGSRREPGKINETRDSGRAKQPAFLLVGSDELLNDSDKMHYPLNFNDL